MTKRVNKFKSHKGNGREPPNWEKSNDEMGFMPKNDIICNFCGTAMTPRLSLMEIEKKGNNVSPVTMLFKIAYKCKMCDWLVTFDKMAENEYWTKILLKRKNRMLFYPVHLWEEDEFIKNQLKALGYF